MKSFLAHVFYMCVDLNLNLIIPTTTARNIYKALNPPLCDFMYLYIKNKIIPKFINESVNNRKSQFIIYNYVGLDISRETTKICT
jgi:hypothetical protein